MSLKLTELRAIHVVVGCGFLASVIFTAIGCSSGVTVRNEAVQAYYVDSDQAKASAEGKAFEDPSKVAPKASGTDNPSLASLKKEQDQAADFFAKHHDDPKAKEAYVIATDRLATATMAAPELAPKEKYPVALKMYREVLRVEPNNKEAKENSELIIGIYKQLGRPVPN